MKLNPQITYALQPETVQAHAVIGERTVNASSAALGVKYGEPLLVIMDALLSYAKSYNARYEAPVSDDAYAAEHFSAMLAGTRKMLCMDGGTALQRGITTDSKDNGAIESIYWEVCKAAGLDGDNL